MKIAILGYGTVGQGIHEIIDSKSTSHLKDLEVSHILVRKGKEATLPMMCDDIEMILNDPSVDIVVEVLGGIEPAHSYIMGALKAGKHVVSANKAVIAKYMKEFHECSYQHGVKFLYEASCGGGIPWIQSLKKAKRIDKIDEIKGIFNGTTNYILDHMVKDCVQFDVILSKAQELGYAEKDPSADIDGYDIQNKLKISASIAFDSNILANFPTFGIRNIRKVDIDYFTSLHLQVKLMAIAKRVDDHYACAIEPILFSQHSVEAVISENNNILSLHGASIGNLKFYGQGAGKLPTANAIVQDIVDIASNSLDEISPLDQVLKIDTSLLSGSYIIRSALSKTALSSILKNVIETFTSYKDTSYVQTKPQSVYQMHQLMQEICSVDSEAFMARIDEVNYE